MATLVYILIPTPVYLYIYILLYYNMYVYKSKRVLEYYSIMYITFLASYLHHLLVERLQMGQQLLVNLLFPFYLQVLFVLEVHQIRQYLVCQLLPECHSMVRLY